MLFQNRYRCSECGREWTDIWSAQCDDDCPHCGARHMSPYESEDVGVPDNKKIALLNDMFRKTFKGGKVLFTSSVDALPAMVKAAALRNVAEFEEFTADNDPHGEHDFGSFDLCSRKFFWKIDLYEEPDVKDANGEPVVTRVLTLMLAEEY